MNLLRLIVLATVALMVSSPASAGEQPLYQPVPSWVTDPGPIDPGVKTQSGLLRIDRQQRIEGDRVLAYQDIAARINSTEQLSAFGAWKLNWHPSKGDLIVHRAQIIRDDEVVDLTTNPDKLLVLRREQGLEQQWISGILTAALQIEGLRVGDIVRVSVTVTFQDPAQGGKAQLVEQLVGEPLTVASGAFSIEWPETEPVKWRVNVANASTKLRSANGITRLTVSQPLPKQPEWPAGAPARFAMPPLIEASSFASWEDVSRIAAQHYAVSASLIADGDLATRVDAIAQRTSDPLARAAAALRLVQDDIRYLFNGQSQGNYVPQSPMDTWQKKYGDCKAKTLLLMAVLNRLSLPAEAALVSSQYGDALPERLPSMAAFDHVIVRMPLGNRIYWLDGTTRGTRLADLADTPPFRYVLPLRATGSGLEAIAFHAAARPREQVELSFDASAGIYLPKPYKVKLALRDPALFAISEARTTLTPKQFNAAVDEIVTRYVPDANIVSRSIEVDDEAGVVAVEASGIANRIWRVVDGRAELAIDTIVDGWNYDYDRARPDWAKISAVTGSINGYRALTKIKLPDNGRGFVLKNAKTLNMRIGGFDIEVATKLADNMVEIDEAWRGALLEIPASDLAATREKLALAQANQAALVSPADYPPRWKEVAEARTKGRLAELERSYAAGIKDDPENANAYIDRARFRAGTNDREGAIADFSKAIAIDPATDTLIGRADAAAMTDTELAIADLKTVLERKPGSADAVARLTEIYQKNGQYDDALMLIEQVTPLQSDRTALVPIQAELLAVAGRGEEALRTIDAANAEKPGTPSLLNSACWVRAILSTQLDSALKSCTKAIELTDSGASILDSRGVVYFRMGRFDEAISDFDAALRIAPGLASSIYMRGLTKLVLDQREAGLRDLTDAKTIEPEIAKKYAAFGLKPKS